MAVPFLVLAPMDDVTDTVFRQIVADCSPPDLYFTEFVNVDGLQSAGRTKLLPKLRFSAKEVPLIAQIWGKDVGNYKKTAAQLVDGSLSKEANADPNSTLIYAGIDINMGCPDKSICSNGCCAALINDRVLAGQIIKTVQKEADGKLPVSVKTRIGYNTIDLTWIEFLLEQNLDTLSIHARTKKEMSKVPNHWEVFETIIAMRDRLSPATKIIGNGDVINREQGLQLIKKYKLDAVMIGRGALTDPYVFSENSAWPEIPKLKRLELFERHIKLFDSTWRNNERRLVTLNKFCKIYVSNFDGAVELRVRLMAAGSIDELLELTEQAAQVS